MMHKLLAICLICFVVVGSASRKDVTILDVWDTTEPAVILSNDGAPPAIEEFQCVLEDDSNIFGGERDVYLVMLTGQSNQVLSVSISNGDLNLAAPNGATGTLSVQYDGNDCSEVININGLGGVDLTYNRVDSFHLTGTSDHFVDIQLRVYSPDGGISTATFSFLEELSNQIQDVYVPFSQFSGDADFRNVGAFEIYIDIEANVDALINTFALSGPERVRLIAPIVDNECNFEKGCCLEIAQPFPITISTTSTSTPSTSTEDITTDKNIHSYYYYDYDTTSTMSAASLTSTSLLLSLLIISVMLL